MWLSHRASVSRACFSLFIQILWRSRGICFHSVGHLKMEQDPHGRWEEVALGVFLAKLTDKAKPSAKPKGTWSVLEELPKMHWPGRGQESRFAMCLAEVSFLIVEGCSSQVWIQCDVLIYKHEKFSWDAVMQDSIGLCWVFMTGHNSGYNLSPGWWSGPWGHLPRARLACNTFRHRRW